MKQGLFPGIAIGLLLLAVAVAFVQLELQRQRTVILESALIDLRDSVNTSRLTIDSLVAVRPGLGEYMSTMQLHAAKLWFAGQASNWKLASYEIDELEETAEAAMALHAMKNSISISMVLQSLNTSQIPRLKESVDKRSPALFSKAYSELLAACNGCHRPAGYEFIHIVTPNGEPVTNQQWKPVQQ